MKNKRTLILTSLICLIPILVGAAVYSRLPETMPTHWNFQGEADGWSSRPVAVFALPGILLAVNLLLPLALKADPKHENMSPALKAVVFWTIPVLSLVCSGATIAAGLGYHLSIERIVPALMGVLFVLIGNYLPKTTYAPSGRLSVGDRRALLHRDELLPLESLRFPDPHSSHGACAHGVFLSALSPGDLNKTAQNGASPPEKDPAGMFILCKLYYVNSSPGRGGRPRTGRRPRPSPRRRRRRPPRSGGRSCGRSDASRAPSCRAW